MLKIAALVLASATAASAAARNLRHRPWFSSSPWWEKVTVTIDGNGTAQACRYETSIDPAASQTCDVNSDQATAATKASSSKGEMTRITFERRFDPGCRKAGGPILQLATRFLVARYGAAIDPKGSVKGCRIVAASGSMRPQYSCDDATAEHFQASVGTAQRSERDGYMTILVYGHAEHMV